MKLLVIGPHQSASMGSAEGRARQALQAAAVERYVVYTPRAGEGKLSAALRILRETKKEEFDTVSAQDPFFVGLVAWKVARRAGARFNVQVHADLYGQSFLRHILAQIVLRHADSVRVVSEKIKTQVDRMGVQAKITVLPVYIDVSRFTGLQRTPERMVLWIGRFEKEKDPLLVLEILKSVPDVKLVMLGAGSMEAMLKEKAKNLPVEFPGWQDPLGYFVRAGVVVCTSPAESFGMSMVEALAAGVPVVASDVGVAKEAGAIVVPREKLAEAVAETLRMGERGRLQLPLLNKEAWVKAWKESL